MGIDPVYFLDEMRMFEVDNLIRAYNAKYMEAWEQTREICYFIASSQSLKKLKRSEVMPFSWDGENKATNTEVLTKEDRERLLKKAAEVKDKILKATK